MAYHALIYFLKQSEDLVEVDEALEEEIYYENVKLLLGTEIRLPNSLIRSMKGSFYLQPFENFTEKYSELIGDLRSKTKFLDSHLTKLTKSRHETNPFPYMKGLPDGDHGDFEKVDFYADEVNNKFASYLYENMLFSSLDESDSDAKSLEAEFEESSEHGHHAEISHHHHHQHEHSDHQHHTHEHSDTNNFSTFKNSEIRMILFGSFLSMLFAFFMC